MSRRTIPSRSSAALVLTACIAVQLIARAGGTSISYGVIEQTTVSPAACNQPGSCSYLCAERYAVTETETGFVLIEPVPTSDASQCDCASGTGQVDRTGKTATVQMYTGNTAAVTAGMEALTVEASVSGLMCTGTYKVTSGKVLGVSGPAGATAAQGFIVLQDVSPAACKVPSSCSYLCGEAYRVTQMGESAELLPENTSGQCFTCYTGEASITGTKADITFPDSTATAQPNGAYIDVAVTISGQTCTGTYSVVGGSVLGLASQGPDLAVGHLQLQSVEPAACQQPTSCDYVCASSYFVYQLGMKLAINPTYTSTCTCTQGGGTLGSSLNEASISFQTFTGKATGDPDNSIIHVTGTYSTADGLSCNGVYAVTYGMVLGVPSSQLGRSTAALQRVSSSSSSSSSGPGQRTRRAAPCPTLRELQNHNSSAAPHELGSTCAARCREKVLATQTGTFIYLQLEDTVGGSELCSCSFYNGLVDGSGQALLSLDGAEALTPGGSSISVDSASDKTLSVVFGSGAAGSDTACEVVYKITDGSLLGVGKGPGPGPLPPSPPPPTPGGSGSGSLGPAIIALIVCGVVAFLVIGAVMAVLFNRYNKQQRDYASLDNDAEPDAAEIVGANSAVNTSSDDWLPQPQSQPANTGTTHPAPAGNDLRTPLLHK